MSTFLASPPRIKQKGSTCWAAAAASWSQVTSGVTSWTAADLLEAGKDHKVASSKGALKGEDGIEWLKKTLSMKHQRNEYMAMPEEMEPRLDNHGHVLYLYRYKGWKTSVHAVVVWGVDDDYICFMDPQVGQWTFPDWNLFEFSWELCLFKAY